MDTEAVGVPGDERSRARVFGYLSRSAEGLDREAAESLAGRLLSGRSTAPETLAREGLHLDLAELGGSAGILASRIFSTMGLFGMGTAITLLAGRKILSSGLRQVLSGVAAAAISFGVGHQIGVGLG